MSVISDNNDFSFKKNERLYHRNEIQELFKKGSSFYLYPFKVIYIADPFEAKVNPQQILISVPKRKFKKAPDRNFIKRQVREAYRQHKILIDPEKLNRNLRIAYIYTSDKKMPSDVLTKKLKKTLERLHQEFTV
ncbi:ribonuclease P protein component [Marivirga harenae]|uniref:ribonuclease P protein component n=1 Tax=Marivirga harenae TaxID=2010992 RepID=UPI0026E01E7A|nr:ribonuclease P protein component [Marivirga harenae]WKV12655.1 ribonuclease P protein component [Marivirga harenae]|tara:strand:+ start:35477 stop:35878 length:402 start_codon:yes stop_codon:yes gene_type:complete